MREVPVAPLHQDHDRREQVAAGVGQPVLVAVGIACVERLLQQALVDQGAQSRGQGRPRDLQVTGQLAETAHPEERLAQDQQRPPLTHDLQGARDRLALEAMRQIGVFHGSANVPVQKLNR